MSIILQRISTNKHYPKVIESENIGANHLGFTKFLFQHYCQHLGLNHNHISAESAFNFYVNKKISSLLGTPVNTESARETFYKELIQNTNLPTNHNFASIITEINKKIKHHTQQKYPITYASKGKGKLQTPVKTRVELPTVPSYHYILRSAINITLSSAPTSNAILTFRQFLFQTNILKDLSHDYQHHQKFDHCRLNGTLEPLPHENYLKKKRKKNQKIKNLLTKTQSLKTRNLEPRMFKLTLQNQNPKVINQHLSSVIVIDQPPVEPIGQPIQIPNQQTQQPPPVPPQQQQQLPSQQQQQMAYAPIAKLDKFTGKKDDAQVWLNNVKKAITANGWNDTRAMQAISYFLKNTVNSWYQSLVDKPQDFNTFKLEFLKYFSNNNSINRLANTFTTIKQGKTKAVFTYLGHFHRNLDFKSAELEANHVHAMNLVMNGLSELDSKLKQFSDSINQKLKGYLADNRAIYQPPQQCNNPGNTNHFQNQSHPSSSLAVPNQSWQPEMHVCHNCGKQGHIRADCRFYSNNSQSGNQYQNLDCRFQTLNHSPNQDQTTYLPTIQPPIYQPLPQPQIIYQPQSIQTPSQNSVNMTSGHPRPRITQNWRSAMVVHQLIPSSFNLPSGLHSRNLGTSTTQNLNFQNYLSLLVTPEDVTNTNSGSNQQLTLTSNILPTIITEDESLAAIFSFKIEELSGVSLFSRTAIKKKPITAMYTNAKIDGHSIKFILDIDHVVSARIIIANRATKTPIGKIDNLSIEINGITVPIKVLVMKATQYQALIVPATCGHFKPNNVTSSMPLINLEEEKPKPTWKAYQVLKQKEELTWETDDLTWTDNKQKEPLSWEEKKNTQANNTYILYTYGQQQSSTYC
ncbi:hypothetical protein G9A89_014745 [Geosiphon pyriformis]|nr:hypothetical protein G9A89_014745 [Geosiphon pyriformis]